MKTGQFRGLWPLNREEKSTRITTIEENLRLKIFVNFEMSWSQRFCFEYVVAFLCFDRDFLCNHGVLGDTTLESTTVFVAQEQPRKVPRG